MSVVSVTAEIVACCRWLKKNTATATAAKTTTTAPAAADTEKSWKLKDNLGTVLVVTAVVAVVVTVVAAQGS